MRGMYPFGQGRQMRSGSSTASNEWSERVPGLMIANPVAPVTQDPECLGPDDPSKSEPNRHSRAVITQSWAAWITHTDVMR